MKFIIKMMFVFMLISVTGCVGLYPGVSSEVTKVATGFKFTEGPALAPNGDIYFTDIHNSRIHIWSSKGKLSTYRENTGRANGLIFDQFHNLVVCEGGNRRVTSISKKNEVRVIAESFGGKKLNSPNDLWIDSNGGMYFTDPRYWKRDDMEQKGEHVYYLSHEGSELKRVIDDMVRPNGIIGTPCGKALYVADHGDKKTYSYRIKEPGVLVDKKLFADTASDGMTLDTEGNLYITTDAVYVYNPEGKLLKKIAIPERPTNVCFGKDEKTLFITARTSLYAIRLFE